MNNKAPYFFILAVFFFILAVLILEFTFIHVPRRLEHPMSADALAALVERCDAAHGVPRVRMVETGENVGMVNAAYCELSNQEPINDTYFGVILIDGVIERRSEFKALPRE